MQIFVAHNMEVSLLLQTSDDRCRGMIRGADGDGDAAEPGSDMAPRFTSSWNSTQLIRQF